MPIIFYSMGPRCGFCTKAEQMLHKHIASGKIIKKDASEANGKFSGFPSFICTETGKTHSGLPSSPEELYQKLGVEHYNHMMNSHNSNMMKSHMMNTNMGDSPSTTGYCPPNNFTQVNMKGDPNIYENGIIFCNLNMILLYSSESDMSPVYTFRSLKPGLLKKNLKNISDVVTGKSRIFDRFR